jgi:hypothetical protein
MLRLLLSRNEGVSGDFRRDLDDAQLAPTDRPMPATQTGVRQQRSIEATAEVTRRDVGPITEAIRGAGAVPIWLTYPITLGPMLAGIDEAIVGEAAARQAQVIDLREMAAAMLARASDTCPCPTSTRTRVSTARSPGKIARTFIRDDILSSTSGR